MTCTEPAVNEQRVAVAVSRSSQSFVEDVAYALSQLRMQHLKLKRSNSELLKQYAMEMTFLSLFGFGKSICFHVLPFLFDRKLGRMEGVVSLLSHH